MATLDFNSLHKELYVTTNMLVCAKVPSSRWNLCFMIGVCLILNIGVAGAQRSCFIERPEPVKISEIQPAGSPLLELVGGGPSARWNYSMGFATPILQPYFRMDQEGGNATLYLEKVFDLEEIHEFLQDEFTFEFKISCSEANELDVHYQWYLTVSAVNEFRPQFVSLPEGGFDVSEAEKVGDIVLVLENYVEDKDVALNFPGYDFALLPYSDPAVDGRQKWNLASSLTGALSVRETLDYDSMDPDAAYYMLNVSVGDRYLLPSTGTVRINIIDADDQPPEFWYPECPSPCFTYYRASIRDDFQGAITWLEPAAIAARDLDTLGSPVTYNIKQGHPENYVEFVTIDGTTGVPSVIKPVTDSDASAFLLIVEAVEDTPLQHSMQTFLWLNVVGRNSTVPTLPPIVIERTSDDQSAFRIATIILGVLFGLVLILLVIVIICTMTNTARTNPVLAKAIAKLSSENDLTTAQDGDTARSRRKSRKSVTLAKNTGDSKLGFMRSLSRPQKSPPALTSYSSFEERGPEVQHLPVSREIDFDHNGVEEMEESQRQPSRISTISDFDVLPYEERAGLVRSAGGVEEERMGLSNPVYESEEDADSVDASVVPMDHGPVYI